MKLNPIQQLRKILNRNKQMGLFNEPSSTFLEEINLKIDYYLNRFFSRRLNTETRWFTSNFKRHKNHYTEHLTEKHKVHSYRLMDLNPLFKEKFDYQRQLALNMIKTQNESEMLKLKNRFLTWVNLKSVGDDKEKLREMTKLPSNKHMKFLLKDQNNKMTASFDKIVSDFYGGAIAFQWKINNDNRVVGKPGGKNPTPSKRHEDHYARRNKWYYNPEKKNHLKQLGVDLKKFAGDYNTPKDGMPGMPIGCRCWAYYIYDVDDLPKDFKNET